MPRIFISYRRDDNRMAAGRIYDHLIRKFDEGSVFMDITSIDPGDDFIEVIKRAVSQSEVLLAVIGLKWLTITDKAGRRRLDKPDDFVRVEIGTALQRGIRVIPLLIDEADMVSADDLPKELKPLTSRNAIKIYPDRFNEDMSRVINAVEKALQKKSASPPQPEHAPSASPLPSTGSFLDLASKQKPFDLHEWLQETSSKRQPKADPSNLWLNDDLFALPNPKQKPLNVNPALTKKPAEPPKATDPLPDFQKFMEDYRAKGSLPEEKPADPPKASNPSPEFQKFMEDYRTKKSKPEEKPADSPKAADSPPDFEKFMADYRAKQAKPETKPDTLPKLDASTLNTEKFLSDLRSNRSQSSLDDSLSLPSSLAPMLQYDIYLKELLVKIEVFKKGVVLPIKRRFDADSDIHKALHSLARVTVHANEHDLGIVKTLVLDPASPLLSPSLSLKGVWIAVNAEQVLTISFPFSFSIPLFTYDLKQLKP